MNVQLRYWIVCIALSTAGCGSRMVTSAGDAAPPRSDAAGRPNKRPPDARVACTSRADCEPDEYCHIERACGGVGECRLRPACPPTAECDPTCGCDNNEYCGACDANAHGVNVARSGICAHPTPARCAGVTCTLVNDCCSCTAVKGGSAPAHCTALCDAPQCEAQGIVPFAYCAAGQCVVGDTRNGCTRDLDCATVDDCCRCGAFAAPLAQQLYGSCATDCFVSACTGLGLKGAVARCIDGRCQLAEDR